MSTPAPGTPTSARGAAVRFPLPPLLFAAPLLVALAVHHWLLPLTIPGHPAITVTGVVLVAVGVIFSLSGAATSLRHRTTLAPHRAVSRLVTTGPFRISRNPMYTGHAVALVGAALWAGSWWPLIAVPLAMLATYRMVISAEEDYLTNRFGADYQRYQSQVRRWL